MSPWHFHWSFSYNHHADVKNTNGKEVRYNLDTRVPGDICRSKQLSPLIIIKGSMCSNSLHAGAFYIPSRVGYHFHTAEIGTRCGEYAMLIMPTSDSKPWSQILKRLHGLGTYQTINIEIARTFLFYNLIQRTESTTPACTYDDIHITLLCLHAVISS